MARARITAGARGAVRYAVDGDVAPVPQTARSRRASQLRKAMNRAHTRKERAAIRRQIVAEFDRMECGRNTFER